MAIIKITYEHPPGTGQTGCSREFLDSTILESNRGKLRADEVAVGDCLQTTPRYKSLVIDVEILP